MSYSVAVINLSALKENAKKIKSNLSENVKFCAVVKSDAYGHGLSETAIAIENQVDFFAVSFLEEGMILRYSGIKKPILILIPLKNSELSFAERYNLSVSVSSVKQAEFIKDNDIKVKVHIAVNTGMNRLGVDSFEDFKKIFSILGSIRVQGVFSHFFSENRETCEKQFLRFKKFKKYAKKVNANVICHICASNFLYLDKTYQLDMVRVGIALYGYSPDERLKTTPCMKIYAEKLADRNLQKNQNALYGNFVLQKSEKVSIIKYGYADGAPRVSDLTLNNRCMDISCVKQSKKSHIVMDDALKIAKKLGTIPYEVLVSFSKRSNKVYRDYENNIGEK